MHAVKPADPASVHSRGLACSQAHANVLRAFLATERSNCIVIEDDVTLIEHGWLQFHHFDHFAPYVDNRSETPGHDFSVRVGALPRQGTLAYLASRRFAEAFIPLLESGGIADVVNLIASRGLVVGSYASNGVIHDNTADSMICDAWRLAYLRGLEDARRKGRPMSRGRLTKFVDR